MKGKEKERVYSWDISPTVDFPLKVLALTDEFKRTKGNYENIGNSIFIYIFNIHTGVIGFLYTKLQKGIT